MRALAADTEATLLPSGSQKSANALKTVTGLDFTFPNLLMKQEDTAKTL